MAVLESATQVANTLLQGKVLLSKLLRGRHEVGISLPLSLLNTNATEAVPSTINLPSKEVSEVAMSTSSHSASGTITATDIFPRGDWFKMGGIDTSTNPAKVIQLQSFRDWADQRLVCQPMDNPLSVAAISILRFQVANPQPTSIGFGHMCPKGRW